MKRELLWVLIFGIGIGIILTSSIKILEQDSKMTITEEYIRQEARKLGMIDPNELFDKSKVLDLENNDIEIDNNKKVDETSKIINTAEKNTNDNQVNNEFLIKDEDVNKISVMVPKGSTSKSVAIILRKHRLIKSEWEFRNKFKARNLDKYIKPGTYKIDRKATAEEIIYIITSGNKKPLLE